MTEQKSAGGQGEARARSLYSLWSSPPYSCDDPQCSLRPRLVYPPVGRCKGYAQIVVGPFSMGNAYVPGLFVLLDLQVLQLLRELLSKSETRIDDDPMGAEGTVQH